MLELTTGKEQQGSPCIAERWRSERWAWIESNEPYGIKYDKSAAATREAALRAFIQNDMLRQPVLEFPEIDISEVNDAILRYDNMLFEMRPQEHSDGGYLHEHVARKIAELVRLRYTYRAQETNDLAHRKQLHEQSADLSVALFGSPQREKAAYYIDTLKNKAAASDVTCGLELIELLPDVSIEEVRQPGVLSNSAMEILKPDIEEIFAPALEVVDGYEDVARTHEEALEIIKKMIQAMGFEGAIAELTHGSGFEVNGERLALQVGMNRKSVISNQTLRTVVLHELVHLWGYSSARAEGASGIQGIGTPGTLSSEEGKAGCVEQIMKQKATERGAVYYLACSLFMGTVDGVTRDFRDVYDVLWRRLVVQSGKEDEQSVSDAKYTAARSALRAYRGLSCDTRDLSYSDGNDIAVEEFEELALLPRQERLDRLKFILSHRVNYRAPREMAVMGFSGSES